MKIIPIDKNIKIIVPDNWTTDNDGTTISVFDPDNGVGALQLSLYDSNEHVTDVKEVLQSHLIDLYTNIDIQIKDGYAYADVVDEDNTYWRYWLFKIMSKVLFISYNCEESDKVKEQSVVNSIIKSIKGE